MIFFWNLALDSCSADNRESCTHLQFFLIFELISLLNYRLYFFNQSLNWQFCTFRRSFDNTKTSYFLRGGKLKDRRWQKWPMCMIFDIHSHSSSKQAHGFEGIDLWRLICEKWIYICFFFGLCFCHWKLERQMSKPILIFSTNVCSTNVLVGLSFEQGLHWQLLSFDNTFGFSLTLENW